MKCAKQKKPSNTVRTLQIFANATKTQGFNFVMAIVSTAVFVLMLTYMNPLIIGKIVDKVALGSVEADAVFEVFGIYILMLVLVNVFGQICSKLQDYFSARVQIGVSYELSKECFDALSSQSLTFHTSRFGGSLVSQTQRFVSSYKVLFDALVYAAVPIFASATFAVIILSPIVPMYVVVLVSLLTVYFIVTFLLYKRIIPINERVAEAQAQLSGILSDSISNILAVKTSGREDFEREMFANANSMVKQADSKRMMATIIRGAITSFLTIIIMTLVAIFVSGGNAWFGISAGTLVMMFTYTHSICMQFNRLNKVFEMINRGLGDAHDMTEILDEPKLVADIENAPDLRVEEGEISFENISFSYNDFAEQNAKTAVFKNFSLNINAGQKLGLVGKSGSGKSTLVMLLLRLADTQSGKVLIDGQEISRLNQQSLRRSISYVPQEPLLFHRTIRENIAYGKEGASEEEIVRAAQLANAMEFIEKLPQGLDTLTGERGVKLSGGQRQRIAIARAIISDAKILVLDEATSALDSESEKLIQDSMRNLMAGRTSIVIAHRLSTIASMDRIVVIKDGKIVEDGTHGSLSSGGGEYESLWNRQSGAFLLDH